MTTMSRKDGLALVAIAALAFAVRCLSAPYVFAGADSLIFFAGDPYFHLYRSLAMLQTFPAPLWFDLYTNHPHGAVIPAAPLYDWLLAGVTLLLGGGQATLERVAAWSTPILGTLTLLPVFAIGRSAGGATVGLVAALVYAVLPAGASFAMMGYADHHALVALLAAATLALQLAMLDGPRAGESRWPLGRLVAFAVALAVVRAMLVLTWSGSLLYLALGDVPWVVVAVAMGRRDLLVVVAASALGSVALIAPVVAGAPTPIGGPFSAVELSWLHVLVIGLLAAWAGASALLAGSGARVRTGWQAVAVSAGVAALLGTVGAAASGAAASFVTALSFVGKGDDWGDAVLEQASLFDGSSGLPAGLSTFGLFVFAVPLAFVVAAALLFRSRPWPGALLIVSWAALLGLLATSQKRFENDFAAVGSVVLALALARVAAWGAARAHAPGWRARGAAVALAVLGLAPTVPLFYASFVELARVSLRAPAGIDVPLLTIHGTALRFAHEVAAATPEVVSAGGASPPDYGLLADSNLGHLLQYAAQRPTATNNFGPYIGRENVESVRRFFGRIDEREAVVIARQLGCRYVVTNVGRSDDPLALRNRLHRSDGTGFRRHPALSHFRLVTEGPAGGVPFASAYRSVDAEAFRAPYKLFEVVEGAQLEVEAEAGARVVAEVEVATPTGRRFVWKGRALAGPDGIARIRVPYATRSATPARPTGPLVVQVDGSTRARLDLLERDVRTGRVVTVDRSGLAARSAPRTPSDRARGRSADALLRGSR